MTSITLKKGVADFHTKTSQGTVYISRSLKPAGAGSALTSTPIDGGNAGRAGSPARGVHFSPVVSEVNWRESYVEPDGGDKVAAANTNNTTAAKSASSSSSSTAGIGRRSRKISAEDSADLPQRVKVTTTEGNKLSVQKIQVTSVAPTSESVSIFVATLPPPERQQQQQHEEPSASPLPPSVMNGNKSATLPAKLKPVKPPKPDDASTHVSIWKRLGIGRLSFGKSGKSSKQQHQQQQQPSPPPPNKVATKEVIQPEPVPIHATPTKSTSQEMPEPTSTERNESLSESPGKKDVLATSESPSPSPPQQQQNKSDALPPRPPNQASKHLSPVARARLISARKHFLATQGAAQKPPSTSSGPLTAEEAAKSSENLRVAFERFRQKAEEDRRRLAQSVPDLQEVESSVRSAIELKHRQDALLDEEAPAKEERKTVSAAMTARKNDMMRSSQEFDDRWREILAKSEIKKYGDRLQRASQARFTARRSSFSSDITDATARPGNARYHNHHGKRMHQYSTAAQFFNDRHRSKSVSANDDNDPSGLDSGEVLFLRETHLGRLDGGSGGGQPVSSPGGGVDGGHVRHVSSPESMKARSMVNLGDDVDDDDEDGPRLQRLSPSRGGEDSSRAKSMEFLLDDENKQKIKNLVAPSNKALQILTKK
ncbi:unnamed protein product [Notodromas monacha]|uniref:Uncharacterized protein n=1 Tax=Notodromas monacha TaxID=399045 RepID=A0A7R9BSD3_9CRUS|nr:unnamed protein product [Notodromas monacha]CAG0919446.1 unnamed protein product [Notodromas monacha]